VENARRGDRAAQEWVAQRVYEVGLRLAAFSLGDRDLAQDVGQEAAMRAIRSLRGLRDPARFDAWAYRICVAELKRMAKRRGRQEWQPYEDVLANVGVESRHPELVAERDWLVPALARLSERQRIVVALRYVHDLTDKEIASVIRARRGTVRSLLSRALASLREQAEEMEREEHQREKTRRMGLSPTPGMEVSQ
jgi:RNA polymerase sigma factor (sigma-70 family)